MLAIVYNIQHMVTEIREYRCPVDNKLLFKGLVVEGIVEIKCKHCKETHRFEPTPMDDIICRKIGCQNRVHHV